MAALSSSVTLLAPTSVSSYSLFSLALRARILRPGFSPSLHTLCPLRLSPPCLRTSSVSPSTFKCAAQHQPSQGRSTTSHTSRGGGGGGGGGGYGVPVLERDEKTGEFYVKAPARSTSPLASQDAGSTKQVKAPPARISVGVKRTGAPIYTKAARRFYNAKFRSEPERLSKVLAAAGVASRRGSEDIIFAGRVKVNGKVCTVPQTPVDPLKDVIFFDGQTLPKKLAPKLYFVINKPKGLDEASACRVLTLFQLVDKEVLGGARYICSSAEEGSKPVLSLFDDYWKIWEQRNVGVRRPRLFTVGRLDVATSGLLLVTNDGDFAQRVSHPSSGLTKEYVATVSQKITKRQMQLLAEGTIVQGVQCVPREVEPLASVPGDSLHRIRIVVCEGRNHEVRELVANAGLEIVGLKRVRVGGLSLSRKLGPGKHELLTEAQVNKVLANGGQPPSSPSAS